MNKINYFKIIALVFLLSIGCSKESAVDINNGSDTDKENTNEGNNPEEKVTLAPDIFKKSTEGYSCFRIPAIVKTKDNTLLAFAEGRVRNCKDEGDINLVLRRSTDNGKTWSDLIMVWDDADNTCGNPSPVVDLETGTVHLLMTWNLGEDRIGDINAGISKDTRRVYYTRSVDDGLTWETPKEITSQVKDPSWGWYATGPVHGIILTKEPYKGRIVVPCDYIEVGAGRKGYSHVIYSDDNGVTWKIGGKSVGGNESTVAELSDGRLMLNMRNSSPYRTVAYSEDGGETWSPSKQDYALPDPTCQASLLNGFAEGKHTLFFSNAASSSRVNMTIKKSIDDGKTWPYFYVVNEGPSAYSDVVMISDSEIGILYENGKNNPYEKISFEKIKIQKIN
ncbi:MAG: sialidase family protein [Fermentimonas sp.]|jgi:sialidase-1